LLEFDTIKDIQYDAKLAHMHPDNETVYHLMLNGVDPLKLTQNRIKSTAGCFNSIKVVFRGNYRRLTFKESQKEDRKILTFIYSYNFTRIITMSSMCLFNQVLIP
jgi:hypothetical protein